MIKKAKSLELSFEFEGVAGFALGLATAPRNQCARPLEAIFRRTGDGAGAPAGRGVAGLVENLSFGGAFVRTLAPAPVGAAIALSARLPTQSSLETRGVVSFVAARGMGIRFVHDPASMADLRDALTLLAARPRRALVVDDDALVRQRVADALVQRGFAVLTATSALDGLRTLSEELLGLDLLVTDLKMPGRCGEELIVTVRQSGVEVDLIVAVMTGSPDAALAARLLRLGADLVMAKELGPEIIAMKLDALLERRLAARLARYPASRPAEGASAA